MPMRAVLRSKGVTATAKFVLGIDLIDNGNSPADCGNIAGYAKAQGLAGVMVWDLHEDAVLHGGTTPCLDQIALHLGT